MKKRAVKLIASAVLVLTLPAAPAVWAQTQRIEATTTTTTEGTLTEFGPQGVVIETRAGEQPVRYLSTETTNYVDEAGNPVPVSTIKSGVPVQVFYTKVGDTLIASKVRVRKVVHPSREPTRVVVPGTTKVVPVQPVVGRTEVPAPPPERVVIPATPPRDRLESSTLTTTRWGTVSGFGEDTIILQSDSAPEPFPYRVTKKTTYVDEAGTPILPDTIRRGAPVIIYSTREGDKLIASRIILKKAALALPVPEATEIITVTPKPGDPPATIIEKKTTTTTTQKK